ncbi:MAG: type VI secretion system baseplate subunit TssK [Phycisphaera sp.]|nr:MAG: type VI secretion system baseplate subunit TssK [Phycisphaera sp.]
MAERVHWHEGLFLLPQHLQALQRQIYDVAAEERGMARSDAYGLVSSELSEDGLRSLVVRYDRLRAVMPSGVFVDYPGNADLSPLQLGDAFDGNPDGVTVYLGLPLHHEHGANVGEGTDGSSDHRFVVHETERTDENTGDSARPMMVRKLNARLVLSPEADPNLEVIPLVRLRRSAEEAVVQPVPGATAPVLVVGGSVWLGHLLRELSYQAQAASRELSAQLTRTGMSVETLRGAEIAQLLKLQAIGRGSARLSGIAAAPWGFSPRHAYIELSAFIADLAALLPESERRELPAYDHDRIGEVFSTLNAYARSLLAPGAARSYLSTKFAEQDGAWVATLTKDHLERPNEYFLCLQTSVDPGLVTELVQDAATFKLMSQDSAQLRIRGVRLSEERHPPTQLPARSDHRYFRLLRAESETMWERIVGEGAMSIVSPRMDELEITKATLFMTVPS